MTSLASAARGAFESRLAGLPPAATDGDDLPVEQSVTDMLRLVRENLGMDVVFIAQYVGERSVVRCVDADTEDCVIANGESWAREDTLCQRVLDGRLPALIPHVAALRDTHDIPTPPFPLGAYMSTPVRLHNGRIYGTLCCFSFEPRHQLGQREFVRLQMAARLMARLIDVAHGRADALPV